MTVHPITCAHGSHALLRFIGVKVFIGRFNPYPSSLRRHWGDPKLYWWIDFPNYIWIFNITTIKLSMTNSCAYFVGHYMGLAIPSFHCDMAAWVLHMLSDAVICWMVFLILWTEPSRILKLKPQDTLHPKNLYTSVGFYCGFVSILTFIVVSLALGQLPWSNPEWSGGIQYIYW